MTKTGPFRTCWTSLGAEAAWIARRLPAFIMLALAGCSCGPAIVALSGGRQPPECLEGPPPPTPDASRSTQENQSPPPRTLPGALHAYCRCLRYCPPVRDIEPSKTQGSETGTSKNGDGDKDEDKAYGEDNSSGPEENSANKDKEKYKEGWCSAHAQGTVITQKHSRFQSPYSAFNSLPPVEPFVTSDTATAFLAARLWDGGELVFNPEVAGGKGFGNAVTGIANYPNQEITRVGIEEPTPYIARLYLRQTFGFGGEQEKVEDGANQIAGSRDISRLTISVGKMGATDIVDDNLYSHDSRTSFLPWAMVYNGAWDYPANVRGYTYGVAFDLNQKDWTLRYGLFAVARFANSAPLDPHLLRANGHVVELETRYTLDGHPGKLRLLGYLNLAHMGKYSEAIAEMPVNPDITLTRAYRIKYGFGFNLEQELTKDLGAFARFGWDDGHTETWMFTEIDTTFLLGLTLKGRCWCRPQDQLGLALALNGLSSQHRDYLAAGGLGFIIGDGRLNYGLEKTLEAYYSLEVRKGLYFALDLQGVDHPAYNKDRGPVFIVSGRMHIEF